MKLSPNAVAELSPTVSALRGKLSGAAAVTMILAFLVALSPAYYLLIRRCLGACASGLQPATAPDLHS